MAEIPGGKGARIVSVATLVQSPFTSLIGPKLSFGALADLATKPIGTQGLDYQQAFATVRGAECGKVVLTWGHR